jgi:hypothetical protein
MLCGAVFVIPHCVLWLLIYSYKAAAEDVVVLKSFLDLAAMLLLREFGKNLEKTALGR